jgi:hypothetical protein
MQYRLFHIYEILRKAFVRKSVLILLFLFSIKLARAQEVEPATEKLLPYVLIGQDTLPVVYLDEVFIFPDNLSEAEKRRLARRLKREEKKQEKYDAAYARLRYNVYKVYPYAQIAAVLLKDVHAKTEGMSKDERKKYLKTIEKELNKRFKGELEQFTISQGVALVKLINRQTGRSCFDIIKEVKGGFNAVVWQGVALVFNNNLRKEYDPLGKDKDIESIVLEIERAIANNNNKK